MIRVRHGLFFAIALAGCKSDTPVLRAACEAGDAHACEVVAARLVLGTDGPPDEAEAAKLQKQAYQLRARACAAGDQAACAKMTACIFATAPGPVDLPKAAGGNDVQMLFNLELHADGKTFVNGAPLADDAALAAAAKKAVTESPDVRAVIRADTTVQHGRVIRALDILKQAGISKIAFGVSPAAPAP